MSLSAFLTGLHKLSPHQLQKKCAQWLSLAALLESLSSALFFLGGHWPFGLVFGVIALMNIGLSYTFHRLGLEA